MCLLFLHFIRVSLIVFVGSCILFSYILQPNGALAFFALFFLYAPVWALDALFVCFSFHNLLFNLHSLHHSLNPCFDSDWSILIFLSSVNLVIWQDILEDCWSMIWPLCQCDWCLVVSYNFWLNSLPLCRLVVISDLWWWHWFKVGFYWSCWHTKVNCDYWCDNEFWSAG